MSNELTMKAITEGGASRDPARRALAELLAEFETQVEAWGDGPSSESIRQLAYYYKLADLCFIGLTTPADPPAEGARTLEAERKLAQAFSRDAFDQFNRERERAEKAEQERDEIAKELDARSAGRVVVAGYICNDRELKIQTGKQAEWTSISMLLCKQRPASGPCISNGGDCRKIVVTEEPINAS